MKARRWDVVALGGLGLAVAVTAAVYERLPDPVATHFDLRGNPDGWMPRPWAAWGMPAFALVLWAAVRFAARVLPSIDGKKASEGTMALMGALTAIFMAAVHVLILYVALVPGAGIDKPLFLVMGALWVCIGLVLPRVRRNPVVGIRTPWTLTSDENWARSQRVGGYAMVIGGVAGALAALAGGPSRGALAMACFLGSALVPVVYSVVLARRQDDASRER